MVLLGILDTIESKKIDTGLITTLLILIALYYGLESIKKKRKITKSLKKDSTKVTLEIVGIENPFAFLWAPKLMVKHKGQEKITKILTISQRMALIIKYPQIIIYMSKAILKPSFRFKNIKETFYYHTETDTIWLA